MTYFKNLNGLRAVAVIIVILSHSGFSFIPGGLGVELFFILSGFLITYLSLEDVKYSKFKLNIFFIKRFFRILPPLIFVYFFFFFVNYFTQYDAYVDKDVNLVWRVLFTNYYAVANGMGGLLDGMGILWSLCVEEHFYFLFPIVFLMVIKFSWKISWVFLIIILIMLAWRYLAYFHLNFEKDYFYYASEIKAIYIIAGSLLAIYFISNNSDSKKLSSTDITLLWGSLALLFASYFWGNSDAYRFFWRDLLHVFLLWIIFRFVLMYPQYKYFKFLETKIAKFIGKISYVLYLSHMAFVYLIAKYIELSPLLNFIFVFFISVLFAWIVLQIVERPSSKIKNTILKKYLQEK